LVGSTALPSAAAQDWLPAATWRLPPIRRVSGFGEVKIGLVPAVIAQYVVPKIGVSQARALFVSGERFSAERAFEIGLIHGVVPPEELDATVMEIAQRCLTSAPDAITTIKRVVDVVWESERLAAQRFVVEMLARVRTGNEAREGIAAFKARRRPPWGVRNASRRLA
jgi:methylglutaconyl-CoA hydratase